jgi:putative ABC transport system permease protein
MLLREAWSRKAGTLLGVLAVALVTGLFVGAHVLFAAAEDASRRRGKTMGFNMVYLPRGTSRHHYGVQGCSDKTMPEEYFKKLVNSGQIDADHLSARLERRVEWQGRSILLTGTGATVVRGGKAPLGFAKDIEPGTVVLGHEVAALLSADRGAQVFDAWGRLRLGDDNKPIRATVTLLGRELVAVSRQAKANPRDDIRVFMNLADAQQLLGEPGRINAIEALSCICVKNSYTETVASLQQLLPEAEVEIPDKPKWMVREEIRADQRRLTMAMLPAVVLVAAGMIGAMAYLNVRQRREEIGLLRALGVGSMNIAALFLGKALLVGACGAVLGFLLGSVFAAAIGPGAFDVKPGSISANWTLLAWSVGLAPLLAALAAALPALSAVYVDPAEALRQE